MTIQQAIKQAGEGGKIRRKGQCDRYSMKVSKDMCCQFRLADGGGINYLTSDDILADDWEVVESKPIEAYRKATMEDCQACDEPPDCGVKGGACNIQLTPVHDAIKEAIGDVGFHEHTNDAPEKSLFEVGNKVSVSGVVEGSLLACEIVSVNDDLQRATVKPTCTLDVGMEKLILDKPTTFNESDIEPPVIEVGDKITVKDHPNVEPNVICYVTEIREGGQIGFKPSTTHFLGKESVAERVELFEKGAKVHTFEGAIVHKERDGLKIFGNKDDAFNRLLGNGKRYTLILTEASDK